MTSHGSLSSDWRATEGTLTLSPWSTFLCEKQLLTWITRKWQYSRPCVFNVYVNPTMTTWDDAVSCLHVWALSKKMAPHSVRSLIWQLQHSCLQKLLFSAWGIRPQKNVYVTHPQSELYALLRKCLLHIHLCGYGRLSRPHNRKAILVVFDGLVVIH